MIAMQSVLPDNRAAVLGPDSRGFRIWIASPMLRTLADELASLDQPLGWHEAEALTARLVDAWTTVSRVLGPEARPSLSGTAASRGKWVYLPLPAGETASADSDTSTSLPDLAVLAAHRELILDRLAAHGAWPDLRQALG
jgi:hypothetical protein